MGNRKPTKKRNNPKRTKWKKDRRKK